MITRATMAPIAQNALLALVEERSGQRVSSCYQCGKCTAGCPVAQTVDHGPREVMRAVQLGSREVALGNELIWFCLTCHTCTVRCPRQIEVAAVMETLRLEAIASGTRPAVRDLALFHRLLLASVQRTGHAYELGVAGLYTLLSGHPLANAGLAPRLLAKGKLDLLPTRTPAATEMAGIFARAAGGAVPPAKVPALVADQARPAAAPSSATRAFSYFPGCSLHSMAAEYDAANRLVARALDIELRELSDWTCCGASSAHATNKLLGYALPARNLGLAADTGLPLAVPCPSCYARLKSTAHDLGDGALRTSVEGVVGRSLAGETSVLPILATLQPEDVAAATRRPLAGLRVACYYGCLFVRPGAVTQFDDEENPQTMDRLLTAAGAETIDWAFKTECCGAAMGVPRPEVVRRLAGRILAAAKRQGADCIAVACPLCQSNLDQRQGEISRALGEEVRLPVIYFSQLLGLALGLPSAQLLFQRHLTDPRPLLRAKGLA